MQSKFYIVFAHDDVSQYYCKKIYPYICEYENKLREYIYKMLIKARGSSWIKAINLNHFYDEIGMILFKGYDDGTIEKSNIDRYFDNGIALKKEETNISNINEKRRIVAHNKTITREVYNESKKDIQKAMKYIDIAIVELDNIKPAEVNNRLSDLYKSLYKIIQPIDISPLSKSIANMLRTMPRIDMSPITMNMANIIKIIQPINIY